LTGNSLHAILNPI